MKPTDLYSKLRETESPQSLFYTRIAFLAAMVRQIDTELSWSEAVQTAQGVRIAAFNELNDPQCGDEEV